MKISYIPIIMSIALAGCSNSKMEIKQEPLTGQEYCLATIKLLPIKNTEEGSLVLKREKDDSLENNPVKATLTIVQEGKEYHINPQETLKLYIDGAPLDLPLVNSFQDPLEAVKKYSVAMPSGKFLRFGMPKDITRKNMSFFLSTDDLSQMMTAKKVIFEIDSPSSKNSLSSQKYPITLELRMGDILCIQDFKSSCISKNITPKE